MPGNKKGARTGSPRNNTRPNNTILEPSGTQKLRLLSFLRNSPQSTLDLRGRGIAHPAGRVQELRRLGHQIATAPAIRTDSAGVTHRVAVYALRVQS